MDRRSFVSRSATTLGAIAAARTGAFDVPSLEGVTVQPRPASITDDERRARIEKARRLMAENGIDAMFLEGGSSMTYFTGVHWGNSERTFGVVIPAKGDLAWVTPAFEEERARELIKFSNDVRVWQEDESPFQVIARHPQGSRRCERARSAWRSAFASSSLTACASACRARST